MTTQTSGDALNVGGGNNESLSPPGRAGYAGDGEQDYWNALIPEGIAAKFLGLAERTMQAYRQKGGGPKYVALSSRCLRYRRIWLLEWAETRLRISTSDPGRGAQRLTSSRDAGLERR